MFRPIAAAVAIIFLSSMAAAQASPALVGTWRLISWERRGLDRPFWNYKAAGLLVYTADGHVSAQLYDTARVALGQRWDTVAATAAQAAFAGLITYYGRYVVDTAARTVTHWVERAMSPDWSGSKLVRAYRFLGPDSLELSVMTDASGRAVRSGNVLLWQRVSRSSE